MTKALPPAKELSRLKALHQCRILDTAPEKAFDDITQLAAYICQAPIALVSLIDTERLWFKSCVGLEVRQIPVNLAFCVYAVQQAEIFVIPDTLADERFANNLLVTNDPHIRFYAGMPLITAEGHALGTLCVIDRVPRELSQKQIESLQALSRQVVKELELRQNLAELERTAVKRKQVKGKRGRFLSRIAVGLGAASTVLAVIGLISYRGITELARSVNTVVAKQETSERFDDILFRLRDIEISQHRYVLSGNKQELELYNSAIEAIQQDIEELQQFTADEPGEQERLNQINRIVIEELNETQTAIALRQKEGFEAATQFLITSDAREARNEIREEVGQIEQEKADFLQYWSQEIALAAGSAINRSLIGIALEFAIFSLVFYLIYRETHKRHQTETILEQERDLTAAILDTTGALVIVLDAEGRIIRFNQTCERTTGYTFYEVRHKYFWNLFLAPEEVEPVKTVFANLQAGKFPNTHENSWITKNGEQRLIAWSNTALLGKDSLVEYVIGTGVDITERRKAEIALRKSEATNRALLEAIPDPMIRMTRNGTYLDFLPAKDFNIMLFNSDIQGKNINEVMPVEIAQQQMQYVEQALETGETQVYEFQLLLDGKVHTQEARIVVSSKDEVLVIVRDISDRKRAEEALFQLASIVESSDDAIVGMTLDGKITSWNQGAEKIYGYSFEEAKGQTVVSLLVPPEDTKTASHQESEETQLEGNLNHRETQHRRKDGKLIDVQLTISLVRNAGGEITGTSIIAQDVTDRRAIERMKDEFVSIVSHELRTPLTSLRGSLGLLLTGKLGALSEKGQRMLEIAVNNTDRLIRLINDILDLERLESDKFTLSKQTCNIADLVQQAVEAVQSMADKEAVMLSVATISTQIQSDPDRLIQVLINLLSNAIKFSAEGTTVSLSVELQAGNCKVTTSEHSSSAALLLITIKDQGRGIPANKLETIFDRFQQVDASDSRQKGGTGLGLTICRTIVQQHGGQIWVESTVGKGSTFYITLPIAPANQEIVLPALESRRLILVSQHFLSKHQALHRSLEAQNYHIVSVASGEEAIAQAIALHPTTILLDLSIPDMNGWETMATLKERADTQNIPLIVVSSLSSPHQTNHPDLLGWVSQSVDQVSLSQALQRASGQQERVGRVLIVEDDMDLAHVLTTLFSHHGIQTAHAQTEQEAIELCQRFIPDLLVLDLVLSRGDGYAVVDWLRQQDYLCQMPLVIYSAKELNHVERARLRLGQTEFITKSRILPEALEEQVLTLLNQMILSSDKGSE